MALNDKKQTKRVADAWHYFQKLEDDNRQLGNMDLIQVNNSEMISSASWAASFFSGAVPPIIEEIMNKMKKENKIPVPVGNIVTSTAQNEVKGMVFSYSNGNREFSKYTVNQAKKLCRALTQYIDILEKEKVIFATL